MDDCTRIVISGAAIQDHNVADLDSLMKSYQLAEEARSAFLDAEITFTEYLELLEIHQINIDGYLETLEHNLILAKIL